jgi:hypothetical protein
MLTIAGQVGPQQLQDGASQALRQGRGGELVVQQLHARYFEQSLRKQLFMGANQSGVTTSVALATTYVGLCLSNPIGSAYNLSVQKAGFAFSVAFAAASVIGLMAGFHASTDVVHTTPVTPNAGFLGSPAGVGKLDAAATLPIAPTLRTVLDAGLTGAITTAPKSGQGLIDLEGAVIIPPGGFLAFYTSTASGASGGMFSFQWEESPIV